VGCCEYPVDATSRTAADEIDMMRFIEVSLKVRTDSRQLY
jgi:hypothetical protein